MTELLIPILLILVCAWSLHKKEDFYSLLTLGAQDGLRLLFSIIPSLVVLMSAVSMLRASGLIDRMSVFLAPVCGWLGIPPEVVPLMLIRPVSGSAALAVGAELMQAHGPDSLVGRTPRTSFLKKLHTSSIFASSTRLSCSIHARPSGVYAPVSTCMDSTFMSL